MDYDVVVCGYGPTGAVAANLLGQRGVRTLVIDRSEEIYDIPRAVHFDGETMRIFQSIDLADEVKAMSGTAEALAFVNGRGRTLISAHAKDFAPRHGWPTGNFFNQPRLEAQLRAGAARFPSVEVRLGSELESFEHDELSVRVGIRRTGYGAPETVSARYLLGCDGATSPVREIAGQRGAANRFARARHDVLRFMWRFIESGVVRLCRFLNRVIGQRNLTAIDEVERCRLDAAGHRDGPACLYSKADANFAHLIRVRVALRDRRSR